MRISVDRNDPGYSGCERAAMLVREALVILDGELVQHAITADDVIGEVVCYKTDNNGRFVFNEDGLSLKRERFVGKVEIFLEKHDDN